MGVCLSTSDVTHEKAKNKAIEEHLRNTRNDAHKELKLLLLGTGESGKSTIFKQMKIIHTNGFSESEKRGYIQTIHKHCIENMHDLLQGATMLGAATPEFIAKATDLFTRVESEGLHEEIVRSITEVWKSDEIQHAFRERSQFQLSDSARYFLDNINRISAHNYLPTYEDILMCRVRTTGVSELHFVAGDMKFRMVDVGGQRNERRKWIHCFEDVEAVIFVTAINEYDQVLFEDERTNRLKESLRLFSEMSNTRFFSDTTFILFLNKRDLFEEKIKRVSLKTCFPEYEGPNDFESTVAYIKQKFYDARNNKDQEVFIHVTTATSTGNIRFVFDAVKESILLQNVSGAGMI